MSGAATAPASPNLRRTGNPFLLLRDIPLSPAALRGASRESSGQVLLLRDILCRAPTPPLPFPAPPPVPPSMISGKHCFFLLSFVPWSPVRFPLVGCSARRRRRDFLCSAPRLVGFKSELRCRERAGHLAMLDLDRNRTKYIPKVPLVRRPSLDLRCRRRIMGLLALERLLRLDRRRRQTQTRGIPNASVAKRKGSPCLQENNYQGGKRTRSSGPDLPLDIWYHIHSLLPLRDAARASYLSRAFRCSWRCHPNLTFSKRTMGLNCLDPIYYQKNDQTFIDRVGQIMKNHWGIGVKRFKFEYYGSYFDTSKLNDWLRTAVTPGIEELKISLYLGHCQEKYNFPCSLLFSGNRGNSIRSLDLSRCAFRPMAGLGCLTRLHLCQVHITGDELGCLLSSSFALEELDLKLCNDIICLKIPCLLHRLSRLKVSSCRALEVIENKAPNLCTVCMSGDVVHTSIGDSLQVKNLKLFCYVDNVVHHARAKLPENMPNLETLSITSPGEMFSTPSVPGKFLHLKHLDIFLEVLRGAFSLNYDYFSLVFFLDACPILETFKLEVDQTRMKHDSVLEDASHLRQMPGHRHGNIKKVEIIGFCSAKSMVELTCHILENAASLECLTLDTTLWGYDNAMHGHRFGKCFRVGRHMIAEAHKAVLAIERHVAAKVPSTVKLNVMKPCSRCHVLKSRQPSDVTAATVV